MPTPLKKKKRETKMKAILILIFQIVCMILTCFPVMFISLVIPDSWMDKALKAFSL